MKPIFQERVLSLLQEGTYKADTEQGCVYSYRKNIDSWEKVRGVLHHKKYKQLTLFLGEEGTPKSITVYEHYVIYLAANGPFDPKMKVAWKDGDTTNNKAWNLFLVPRKDPSKPRNNRGTMQEWNERNRVITEEDAIKIQALLAAGETNITRIAEAIQRKRATVSAHINKLRNPTLKVTDKLKKKARSNRLKYFLEDHREERRVSLLAQKFGFDPRIPAEDQKHLISKK